VLHGKLRDGTRRRFESRTKCHGNVNEVPRRRLTPCRFVPFLGALSATRRMTRSVLEETFAATRLQPRSRRRRRRRRRRSVRFTKRSSFPRRRNRRSMMASLSHSRGHLREPASPVPPGRCQETRARSIGLSLGITRFTLTYTGRLGRDSADRAECMSRPGRSLRLQSGRIVDVPRDDTTLLQHGTAA